MFYLAREGAVVLIVLVTALMGNLHQLSIRIDHVVKHTPCPKPDCFPLYYKVCVDLLKDNSSCSGTRHTCNDNLHCVNMKMENSTFPRLSLPHQTVTDDTFIQVYIAESLILGTECSPPSASDCRGLNTSYQFSNANFSFQIILSDVPITSSSVSTPIYTDPTISLLSSEVSSASHASIGASLSALTSSLTHIKPVPARLTTSSRPSTEPSSDKGPLLGEIIGGVLAAVVIVIVIAVIIICCCWKRVCKPRVTPGRKEVTSPTGTDVEMSRGEVQQGLPEKSEQGIIASLPPTSNQVWRTVDKTDKNTKLPPLPPLTSNNDSEEKKKKSKKPVVTSDVEQEQDNTDVITDTEAREERSRKRKEIREKRKQRRLDNLAAKDEQTKDEQTKDEETLNMSVPTHNANEGKTRDEETLDI